MKCYECKWVDPYVVLTSNPPQYRCTLGFGSHYADHECEYDFMPIVRCKECKWGKPYSDKQLKCNALGLGGLKFPDDFCSYGERREP